MAMPKPATELKLAIATLIGVLFFTWLLQLLLPTMLAALVAEREHRLRAMMKMHGLGDAAYWAIQYAWWFGESSGVFGCRVRVGLVGSVGCLNLRRDWVHLSSFLIYFHVNPKISKMWILTTHRP